MKARLSKSEIYRRIASLRYELNCLNGKREIGTGTSYGYWSYRNNNQANYKIWEAIAVEKIKSPDKSAEKYKCDGFLDDDTLIRVFPKYAKTNKGYSNYSYLDYQAKDLLRRKFTDKIDARINTITREISRLHTLKFNLIGRTKKQSVGDNLAELVIQGCTKVLEGMRFCSPTGREVKIKFDMFKVNTESRYNADKVSPKTPAEIGLHRLRGFVFDAEHTKLQYGYEWAWGGVERYINTKFRRGILKKFADNANNQELADIVTDWKAQIKDTIWCKYLDSASHKSYPLKFKDIYLLAIEGKRTNKKLCRVQTAVDIALVEYLKANPNKLKSDYYNLPVSEVSLLTIEKLYSSKDKQFVNKQRNEFMHDYIYAYLNKEREKLEVKKGK